MGWSGKCRIAVLIPAYNAGDFVERAIASLEANDEPHDIFIVDDGSEPPLSEWLTPRSNLHILRLAENGGITAALNHGLQHILDRQYEYVGRLDADDAAMPERLALQRAFLDDHPEIAAVGSCGEVVSEKGDTRFFLNYPTDHAVIIRRLRHNNCFLHPSLMIRTRVFREIGLYSDAYPSAEDYELLFRLAGRYQLANLPQYLIKYTLAVGGISLSKRREQLASRLKIQWQFRDWTQSDFYLGLLKTLTLTLMPYRIVSALKQTRRGYRRVSVSG